MRHPTKKQAENAMKSSWRRVRRGKLPCRVYHCPICKDWHTTSMPLAQPPNT